MRLSFNSLIFLLFIQAVLTAQQTDSVKAVFNEVVVTATKSETPLYAIGSSISVITAKDLYKRQQQTVIDVLREEPGLSIIEQGGPGKLANVFIRGANPNHTLVIVDGISMNDPSSPNNAFDFSTLNTNDVEKIEIVRGPQSTLYGSDALAGIINIITKRGDKNAQYNINSEGGSNGYYRGSISALGTIGIISYYIAGSRSMSDGISASDSKYGNNEKDGYWNNSISARLGVNLPLNIKLDLIYKYSKSETALDQSEKFGDDPNYTYNIEEHHLKTGVSSSSFGGGWKQQFFGSVVRRVSHSADLTDTFRPNTSSDSYNNAGRIKFEWQNNIYFLRNNIITFGIETGKETARTSYYSTGDWGPFESVFPEQSISTTGIYLQDQLNISNTFFAAIGIRNDNNEKFGGVTTFRIAPAFFINATGTKLKMSYGSGFKAPSLFYLFDPVFGNPELKPEKSRGWDFGIEESLYGGNLILGGTYFDLKLEDMFGFDSSFRTVNIARAASRGFEFTAQLNNIGGFSVRMNYTYNKTRDEYESSPDYGKPLLRRPQDQLSFIAGCNLSENVNVNLLIKYVGRRDDKDFSSFQSVRVSIPDYTLVNIAGSYKILSYLDVTGRIENLFDKKYEEVLYYGTLGRSIYLGMRLGF